MIVDGVSPTLQFLVLAGAAVAVVAAFFKWLLPVLRAIQADLRGGRDALLGRDAVVDTITKREISPALPGIGVRMDHQEEQMSLVVTALVELTQLSKDQRVLENAVADHDSRIAALEDASVERVVSRAESTQAFRTIEAAIKATPDVEGE